MLNRSFLTGVALLCMVSVLSAQDTVWQLGAPGRPWREPDGGVQFVQEAGVNPPPGDPNSPVADQQADDDYYFAGVYPDPIGTVAADEEAVERAFAGTDNDLRFHFNLDSIDPATPLQFSFEANNLDQRAENPNPRYGIEVSVNGTVVHPEQIITPAELATVFTTDPFTAGDVGLIAGAGADNILSLRGVNYSDDGGGAWMGMDYHHLEIVPEPGSMGMMLTGLIWAFPLMFYEKHQSQKAAR